MRIPFNLLFAAFAEACSNFSTYIAAVRDRPVWVDEGQRHGIIHCQS